jgi:hypothetical protein
MFKIFFIQKTYIAHFCKDYTASESFGLVDVEDEGGEEADLLQERIDLGNFTDSFNEQKYNSNRVTSKLTFVHGVNATQGVGRASGIVVVVSEDMGRKIPIEACV